MFVSWMSLSNDTVCDAKLAASYYVGWWKRGLDVAGHGVIHFRSKIFGKDIAFIEYV